MRLVTFITVLLIGCPLVVARPPDPCSLTSAVTDAKLTLGIQDTRTAFREGEIIPLVLSFTSTVDNRYRVADRNYDRGGRLSIDTYCIQPEARDPLAGYFSAVVPFGGGIGSEHWLSAKPFTATAELNEWKQPGPGHYRLWVVSRRVSRPRDASEAPPDLRGAMLRSNTIEFDVIQTDAQSRAKQLQDAIATYENGSVEQQKEAARRLRFLNTKQSAETLVKLFWSLNNQPGGWDRMFGLVGSPYRTEAIAAVRREINSPEHPVTPDFLEMFTKLQIAPDTPAVQKAALAATGAAPEELLPFVQRAVQRIESGEARRWDYSMVEMFGDKSALRSLEVRFKADNDHLPKGNCFPYAVPMLRYFLRVDPEIGARQVQAALDVTNTTGCYSTLFEDLGTFLPKVEQLATRALDDPNAEVSTGAAQALGRWGSAKAESALWARLKRFNEEWHNREGELRITPDLRDPIARATVLERTLLASIVSGTNWICGPKEFNRLRALTSRQNWSNLSLWTAQWEKGQPWILQPYWGLEDQLTFSVCRLD